MGVNFSCLSLKCSENMSFGHTSLSCTSNKGIISDNKMVFLKVPDNIDSSATFNQLMRNNSFSIVLGIEKNVLAVDSKKHSQLFNMDLNDVLGKNIKRIEDYCENKALVHIFINMINKIISDQKFNGFVVQMGYDKYIICGYPITGKEGICGLYIIKHNYEFNFFSNDFFESGEDVAVS